MSIALQINPYEFFVDANGDALDGGFIWIGEANKYSPQYPVVAYFDEALTIPAGMPLRTSNGYVVRNGSPTFLYINGNYSVLVQDSTGRQVYYVPDFLVSGNGSAASVSYVNAHSPKAVASIADLRKLDSKTFTMAQTLSYYAGGFEGGGNYCVIPGDTTTADNGVTIIKGDDNARWRLLHDGSISSAQCGFYADNTTVNASLKLDTAVAAVAAAGAVLEWGEGTFLCGTIKMVSGMVWNGVSKYKTIIKARNGLNTDLVSCNFLVNTDDVCISNMQFDGNRSNNSSGVTVAFKGAKPVFSDLIITQSAGTGLVTDYDTASAFRPFAFEGEFSNILIDKTNGHGWTYNGPNDSALTNITLIDNGLLTDNTFFGLYITQSCRVDNVHPWNRSDVSNTASAGVYVNAPGCNFVNSHFEGGHTPLKVLSNQNVFSACDYYATRGAYCVEIYGTANKLSGALGATFFGGNPNYAGVLIAGSDNQIEVVDGGCINGAVSFNSGGGNFVRVTGYRATGVAYTGVPAANDDVLLYIQGPGGGQLVQHFPGDWKTFATTVTSVGGALGGGAVASMRYQDNGKLITGQITANIPANGTGSGGLKFSLPFTASAFGFPSAAVTTPGNQALQALVQPSTNYVLVTSPTGAHPIGASGALYAAFSFERV